MIKCDNVIFDSGTGDTVFCEEESNTTHQSQACGIIGVAVGEASCCV